MGKINVKAEHFWRNIIIISILIAVAVAMIIVSMPRSSTEDFSCDVGRPWSKGTLIAKFDCPVYKTTESLHNEEDSIERKFKPYYSIDKKIGDAKIADFVKSRNDSARTIAILNWNIQAALTKKMAELYDTGIMPAKDYRDLEAKGTESIRIISGKKSESVMRGEIYSTKTAYDALLADPDFENIHNILIQCNLNDFIAPNLTYEKQKSEEELEGMKSNIARSLEGILEGERIIDQGQMVTENIRQRILSYATEYNKRVTDENKEVNMLAGHIIFVTVLMLLFGFYMILYRGDYMEKFSSFTLMLALVTIFPLLTSLTVRMDFTSVYIIPYCILPVFLRIFLDSRTAFTAHTICILISCVIVQYQYEFIIVQLTAGLVSIYSLREMSRRSQVLKTAFSVVVVSALVYYSLELMRGNIDKGLMTHQLIYFTVNGVLLLLVYPLMYVIEKLFGFTSDVTLVELADVNKGVLRQLSEVAPGTFQHSITVANLAAEVANKIGANSMLVRTGALYHDIGKLSNPVYFTENQSGVNPHDQLPYTESAKIITNHVTYGLTLADKDGLPSFIKEFIKTHHGKGIAKYFYVKQMNEHQGEHVNVDDFTYIGPNPYTKEQAILMMVDTIEAASRSLEEYTEASISGLVNRLIDAQVNEGYFRECPINFRDIAITKQVLTERLKSIHHTRIVYPQLNK